MNAPMRIYVPVMDGEPLSSWHYSTSPYAPEKDVEFIRADIHDAQIGALKAEGSKLKEALELISSLRGPFISEGDIAKCWDTVDEILNAQEVK